MRLSHLRWPSLKQLSLRGPRRFLRRHWRHWLPPAVRSPFAAKGSGLSNRELLAVKCAIAGRGLLVVYLTSVFATGLPLQLGDASWLMSLCAGLVNHGPILILALLTLSLAAHWDPAIAANRSASRSLLWIARLGTTLFALVVVVQLAAAGMLHGQIKAQNRAKLGVLEQQLAVTVASVESAQDQAQFNRILPRLGALEVPLGSTGNETLAVRKQRLLLALQTNLSAATSQLIQQARQRVLGLASDALRVVVSALALATICQGFAQWNGRPRPRVSSRSSPSVSA